MESVIHSCWAAPIVAVLKKEDSIAFASRTITSSECKVNGALDVDQYHLPNPSKLFAAHACGKKLTKLDLSQAYQQLLQVLVLTKYITVITHKGLFTYNRLPFGIASAPAIF